MGIDTHEVLEAASTKFKKVLLNESFVIQNYHSGANKKLRLFIIAGTNKAQSIKVA